MRKYQQDRINEYVETLEDAHGEIRWMVSALSEQGKLRALLADCQNFALHIIDNIESIEGADTETSALLLRYCELLYGVSVEPSKPQFEELENQLSLIKRSVNEELAPNRIEVVFFPYKASMWDSLESVYLAAKEDPMCDVYVVPIPYYENDRVHFNRHVKYEGDLYPSNIPITDWRKYDVKSRRPDVIFIHNPYDGGNYVTAVPEEYYSKNLRNHTDLLCYIPYFVSRGMVSDVFCTAAACLYAHKIFLQSEKIRDRYVTLYKEFEKEQKIVGLLGVAEEKFVALGSPKYDSVLNTKREDCALPEQWTALLDNAGDMRKEDTQKKIVLYNTSIKGILEGNERYLEKLRYMLAWFRKREDVVLWWRPHPLSEATYVSMRPQIFEEYKALVEEYKRQGWGIYDDTADLRRAIACTDMYYGDGGSSLVALYQVTGKPVFAQNVSPHSLWDMDDVSFFNFTFSEDGVMWSFDYHRDGLFKISLQDDKAELIVNSQTTPLWREKKWQRYRFVCIETFHEKVIGFPLVYDHIFIYDINSGETRSIALDRNYLASDEYEGFRIRRVERYDDTYYCFGFNCTAVIAFDPVSETLCYHTSLIDELAGKPMFDLKYLSTTDRNGCVQLLVSNTDKFISYNLKSQTYEVIAENEEIKDCQRVLVCNNTIWLIRDDGLMLIRWDYRTNVISRYPVVFEGFESTQNAIVDMIDCGDSVLLLPANANMALQFDKNTRQFSKFQGFPELDDKDDVSRKFGPVTRIGNTVYTFAFFNKTLYEMDLLSGTVKAHHLTVKCADERKVMEFLRMPTGEKDVLTDGDAGPRIHAYVKSLAIQ